jgi:ABC-type bacteriocin/lantibiotic exporter with double-glycine peptidase domain
MDNWYTYLKKGLSHTLPPDRIAGQRGYAKYRTSLKNLRPFISRHIRKGIIGAILVISSTLITFPTPMITRYITDNVILARNIGLLTGAIILLVVVKLSEKLFSFLQDYYFAKFEKEIVLDIQEDLLEHTLKLPKSFFDEKETGYLMSRISSDVRRLQWFFSSTLVYILSQSIKFIGGIVFLFFLEWRLALIVVIPIPILFLGIDFFSKKIHTLSHQEMEQDANVSKRIQESLSASSLIKAFSSEKKTVKQVTDQLKAALQLSIEATTVNSMAELIIGLLPSFAGFIVLAGGALLIINGSWTLGSLLAFQGYLSYVYGPAQFLASSNIQLQNSLAALERVSALYDIVPEDTGTGTSIVHLQGDVEFKDVSFGYSTEEPVLQEVSCHILPGEHIAIVGPSGVGKTTLVSLLLRFYQPTSGEIYLDRQPAQSYELHSLRQRIGYVSQSTFLLTGTILENLRYGNEDATLEQVIQACKVSGIHDYISGLSNGYETVVGERGVNLSEGQKQRMSIARAVIKNPDIIILDEPTSALDSIIEKSIFESLPHLLQHKTMFVVAHRLATIQNSDRILLLNEKQLVAVGTHQSLLETNDLYRSLVANQQISQQQPKAD